MGHELDPRSDLFSLGMVLYEMVAGQRPFLGRTPVETINNIINSPPPPLGLENPAFSPALDNIILKCLEKERDKRHASAKALADDLRRLREDSQGAMSAAPAVGLSSGVAKAGESRNPLGTWALSLGAAVLLIIGGMLLLRGCV